MLNGLNAECERHNKCVSSPQSLAAAILLGGAARRMNGADKSALVVGGASILSRTLDVLRTVTPHVFAVGDRHGAAAAAGLPVVSDTIPDGGSLGGIYTAIVASPCDRTLVVGGDMPFLSEAFVRHLLHLDGDVVIPRSPHGLEPLCAVYSRAAAAPIR